MFNLRSSVLFLASASLMLSSAWASRSHQAPTSGHAHHHARATAETGSSEDRVSSRHGHASVKHTSAKTSATTSSKKHGKHSTSSAESLGVLPTKRSHGQLSIGSERILQIQQALIREHYLDGEASGTWDSSTNAAMQKFQSDQGWQTRLMPDSRALKKLGLGADYSNAINAKTSSFNDPPPSSTIPADRAAGFAAGSRAVQ